MKQQLRKKVIQYFRAVGSGQNIVQCIKEALFLHESFSPVALFDHLAKGKQKMVPSDISSYLHSQRIIFSEEQFRYYLFLNAFHSQITLNEFLEAMIPFNADVIRQFKLRYLEAMEIKQMHAQVEFILKQLLDNHIKFIRSLLTLRKEITQMATKKQVQSLIKEDLVMKSKPRQSRKFQQSYQNRGFRLGYHELRKFLELWLTSKETVHEFYLLNVMRHLKSDHPFDCIIYRKKGFSGQKRTQSAQHFSPSTLTNERVREKLFKNTISANKQDVYDRWNQEDKYHVYKREVIDQFNRENTVKQIKNHHYQEKQIDKLRRSRAQRNAKGIDGTILIQMLSQIVVKEERLEKLRKNLAKSNDFNLINLFKLVDSKNKGYISSYDISAFLDSKVNFESFIRFYGRESQKLRFHEFCLVFRPLSKQLNEAIDGRQEHKIPNPFKKETMQLIVEVLTVTAEMHNNLNILRKSMRDQRISPISLFHFVDYQNTGRITAQGLQSVLKENNVFCDDRNLKCLMKLLKKKVDDSITSPEFIIFLEG